MEVKSSSTKVPAMIPAEQGVFFDLLKRQIPAWLLEAPENVRTALYKSLKASYRSRSAAREEMSAFKSPENYCSPLLAKAMSDKLGKPLQVEGVVFQHVRSTSSLLGLRKKLVLPINRDLLTAACENFEASETKAQNYHDSSLIYIPEQITGRANDILSIQPHEFAQLCRTLDLGKSYQGHVTALFGTASQTGSLQETSLVYARDRFEVERHVAYLQKHISTDVYEMLNAVRERQPTITLGSNTLGLQRLEMLDTQLHGPMFIGPVSEHKDEDYRCVVYLPGDPLHPLKEYASFTHFEVELSKRLRDAEYLRFFKRFIRLQDRSGFVTALSERLLSLRHPSLPADKAYAAITGVDLREAQKHDMFLAMFQQHAEQVRADARLLVVPTDDEDEKTRLARLETYKVIGLNTMLFVASFVPVIGEILLAVAGYQLLKTIYEGLSSWAAGEQEQATDYLFDTLENLIVMATLAAGGKVVGAAYRAVRASEFVLRLRTVPIAPGVLRLWNADLSAYRLRHRLPRNIRVDARGLVWQHNARYLRIGKDHYAVHPRQNSDAWEVQHPRLSGRYSPVLETNGVGAWRHDSELAEDWNLLTLFRRLGYRQEEVPDAQALQILAAIGVDEQPLRQLFVEPRRPMAILADTVRRFRADTAVNQFIQQIRDPLTAYTADADLQLSLLVADAKWPKELAVSVVDILGSELQRYGRASATQTLKLPQALVDKGEFHAALVTALDTQQRSRLLGEGLSDQASQVARLTELIADSAGRSRLELFNRLDRRTDRLAEPNAEPVRKAFAGLPASVADELALNADAGEWQELESDKLPLRLAEEARRYAQVVRLNRAYDGLYLDAANGLGSDLVVLDALANLPGWPDDVSIEIVEWAVPSEERAKIGTANAPQRIYIEAFRDRYEAFDGNDQALASHPARTRALFFQTLWESLPVHARKALGVETNDGGVGLRQKITSLALQRRAAFARLLEDNTLRAGYRSPMGLADRLVERSVWLTEPPPDARPAWSPVLIRRARELFPSHSLTQIKHFLMTLERDEVLAIRTLESLRQQYLTLRNTLEQWVHRETHYQLDEGPRRTVPRHSKARAAQAILRAWRRESDAAWQASQMLYGLTLDAQPLGELPVLVGDFRHIGALEMNNVGASAGLNAFLHNFINLHALSLTGNGLTRVPQAIAAMPRLTQLDLSNNRILLTADAATQLGAKEHLQSLNLSFNPALGRVPNVTGLRRLRHLALRGTGISQWPVGVDALAELQTLDLRDNRIATLPASLFKARPELNRGTNVDGNPLSVASLQTISAYQQSSGISLGVITADYIDPPSLLPRSDAQGAQWVAGLSSADVERMQLTWSALAAYPTSRDFFLVLEQLRNTADYTRQHSLLATRVWHVLQAAAEDDDLRNSLFRIARLGRVSASDSTRVFSDLEVRVLSYRAVVAARTGAQSLEGELVRLLRGLFRLQEVERQASIEIGSRALSGSISRQQALELSLIYRVRLAQRLDLPAQPRAITVQLDVEVSEEQLEKAYGEVAKAENTPALLAWINQQGFWTEYLHTTYQQQFVGVIEATADALARVDAQSGLPRAEATRRMNAIYENFRNENLRLRQALTAQALARHPGLAVPASKASGSRPQG
jgi:hypothetical protein